MKKDIKKFLIGKKISWYDGFSGNSDYFTINHVENVGASIRVREEKDKGFGVFIPKSIIDILLSKGNYIEKNSIEGCSFEIRWKIS